MRRELTNEELRNPLIEACLEAVADACKVSRKDLLSKDRTYKVARARHALVWTLRSTTTLSFTAIGGLLDRDHSSCRDAWARFKKRYDEKMTTREWARRVRKNALYAASGENIKHAPDPEGK